MTLTDYYTLFPDQQVPYFCNLPFVVGDQAVVDQEEGHQLHHSPHLVVASIETKVAIAKAVLEAPMHYRGLIAGSSCHQPSNNYEANNENCT